MTNQKFTPAAGWTPNGDWTRETLQRTTPHGVFRAVVESDPYAEAPENDGGCPVIRIESGRYDGYHAEATGYGTGYADGLPDTVPAILERFNAYDMRTALEIFERYLRIFHDGTMVERGPDSYSDCTHIAYVTRGLREAWGVEADVRVEAELGEYVAWIEGDVYGIGVERATTFDTDGQPAGWLEDAGMVWGYYGKDYALEEAESALAYSIEAAGGDMLPPEL